MSLPNRLFFERAMRVEKRTPRTVLDSTRTIILLAILSFLLFPTSLIKQTNAASGFTERSVRLDRLQANSPLSGQVCVQTTASDGTEGKISITFPASFSLSTTSANWTTDTSDLPSGATAWPGISSTAQSVSGSTATFGSSDLTSDAALYCFNFHAAASATGTTGQKEGTLTTKTSGGSTITSGDFGLEITSKDQISVTATIPAGPTDFSADLNQNPAAGTFAQNKQLDYTVTYGSSLSTPASISVEATWSEGTISGAGIPTVDLLDYIVSSASNGYNNTTPVVDLTNRKITWTISAFPAHTTRTVTFSLMTNASYTGSSPVTFDVSARVLGPGTATAYSTVSDIYQYQAPAAPTATHTPTNGPTATPGPGQAATPTPTPETRFILQNVRLREITQNTATIFLSFSQPATYTLTYGTDSQHLNKTVTDLTASLTHLAKLTDLTPGTQYYFTITGRSATGHTVHADIFTVTTASGPFTAAIKPASLIVSANRVILTSPLLEQAGEPVIPIPKNTIAQFHLNSDNPEQIKSIALFVENLNVLGLSTLVPQAEASTESVPMLPVEPGVFSGRLRTAALPGRYEVKARITDYHGNLIEAPVAVLRVISPLRVLEQNSKNPIEAATLTVSLFNLQTRIFEVLSPQQLPITNPITSDPDGTVPLVLPAGRYRLEVNGIGYEPRTVDFTLDSGAGDNYPVVLLKRKPWSLLTIGERLTDTGALLWRLGTEYAGRLYDSGRFREFNEFVILFCFVALTFLTLSARSGIPLRSFRAYFMHLTALRRHADEKTFVSGTVLESETNSPVANADVYVVDSGTGKTVLRAKTSELGLFRVPIVPAFSYELAIIKPEYHPGKFPLGNGKTYALIKHGHGLKPVEVLTLFTRSIMTFLFEIMLVLSFVSELILGGHFGYLSVLPFFLVSVLSFWLWLLHILHTRSY